MGWAGRAGHQQLGPRDQVGEVPQPGGRPGSPKGPGACIDITGALQGHAVSTQPSQALPTTGEGAGRAREGPEALAPRALRPSRSLGWKHELSSVNSSSNCVTAVPASSGLII